jgi:hypothetical protein
MENKEKNTQMFMYLAGSFEMSAMMAMGKLKNPMTDMTERDLIQAQFSIDILDMLKAKTERNLSEYESKFLDNLLGQLKLNYIDEMKKDSEKPKEKTETEGDKPAGENAEENKEDTK